jgi:hypothetical protein
VKFNAYSQSITKCFCSGNPHEHGESFDTAPLRINKRHINVSYATSVTTPSPDTTYFESNHVVSPPYFDMVDISFHIPTHTGGKSSRFAEIELSLLSIQSERTSMQSDHTQLRNEFQKVLTGFLYHSKEIQAMQSEVRGLTSMMQEIRNTILLNTSPFPPRSHFSALRIDDELASHNQPRCCVPYPLPLLTKKLSRRLISFYVPSFNNRGFTN